MQKKENVATDIRHNCVMKFVCLKWPAESVATRFHYRCLQGHCHLPRLVCAGIRQQHKDVRRQRVTLNGHAYIWMYRELFRSKYIHHQLVVDSWSSLLLRCYLVQWSLLIHCTTHGDALWHFSFAIVPNALTSCVYFSMWQGCFKGPMI